MSILVTGGAGFIGSITVERLVAKGEDVVVYDDFSTGYRQAVTDGVPIVEGDIHDTQLLLNTMRNHDVDIVMNFAAFIQVGESMTDPKKYFANNVCGAHNVMATAESAGVRRFIQSSTAAVYGQPMDDNTIDETHPTVPVNPYGLAKYMIEQMLQWYAHAYDTRYVVLRYFNACGATERLGENHQPESHLIPLILRAAKDESKPITVFGTDYDTSDGTCVRDYVHVADIADAHGLAVDYLRNGGPSDAVNLGTSTGDSVLEVIDAVRRVTGLEPNVKFGDRRPGDASRLVASAAKAEKVLGWKAKRSDIESIVSDAWNWFEAHPNGYAR